MKFKVRLLFLSLIFILVNVPDIAIANTQVSGLGTMSTQNANSVAITGGSITNLTTFDGITIDGGTF